MVRIDPILIIKIGFLGRISQNLLRVVIQWDILLAG